jgi:hypothetical protein
MYTAQGILKKNKNIEKFSSLKQPDKISSIKVGVNGAGDDVNISFNSSSNACYNKVNSEYLPKMPTDKYSSVCNKHGWKDPTDSSKNFYFSGGEGYKKYLQCKLLEDNNVMACKEWPGYNSGSSENATTNCKKWYNDSNVVDCNTRYNYTNIGDCSNSCGGGTLTKSNVKCKIGDLEVEDKYCEWAGLDKPAATVTESCNTDPCPVECDITGWSEWSNCSADCGGGTQTQSRSIITNAAHGGEECPSNLTNTRNCNTDPCPVECVVSEWSEWSNCSSECGGGSKTRSRSITTNPAHGGLPCPSTLTETINCNENPCPIHCEMNEWSEYSECSNDQDCGEGTKTKTRSVKTNPAHGGTPCPTILSETQKCDMDPCPIDCVVSDWSPWDNCPKCKKEGDDPEQNRFRSITTQSNYGGKKCPTNLHESRKCSIDPCPKWVCMVGDKEAPGQCGYHPNTVNVPITETKEEEKKEVNEIDIKINNKVNELVASNENSDSFDVSKLINEETLLTDDLSEILPGIDSSSFTLGLLS